MSDVEWICEQNHQRVRWAEEITSQSRQSRDSSPQGEPRTAAKGLAALRNGGKAATPLVLRATSPYTGATTPPARRATSPCTGATTPPARRATSPCTGEAKRRGLRMAAMGCAVFTGAGLSIVVRGAQMVHMPTLISGILITIVCLTAGWLFDELAEGMLR